MEDGKVLSLVELQYYLKKKKSLDTLHQICDINSNPLSVPAIKAFLWAISKSRFNSCFNSVTGPG